MRVFVLANEGCGKGLMNRYRVIDLDSTMTAGLSLTTAAAEGLTSCIDEAECPLDEGEFYNKTFIENKLFDQRLFILSDSGCKLQYLFTVIGGSRSQCNSKYKR